MQLTRLITFLLVLVGGGLLQIWVILGVVLYQGDSITLSEILADGGLLFFSSSLISASAIHLFDHQKPDAGSIDTLFSIVTIGLVFIITIVFYTASLASGEFAGARSFSDHINTQLACVGMAISYWIFCGFRTGLFVKKGHHFV